jgi:nucleoside-diphosphate-sugar epimerase
VKVLVTGAGGRLGRHVVEDLVAGAHTVRAVLRPGRSPNAFASIAGVEIARADLRAAQDLGVLLNGVDAVIHLAAAMSGSDAARFSETVLGTERLFDAIDRATVRRVILCSSFSVYDWLAAGGTVDESLATSPDIYASGGYASAKLWQERLAQRRAAQGWQLTILRPGFIWGAGNELPLGSLGPRFGRLQVVLSPLRTLPFTHFVNCARAFRDALESPQAIGAIVNIVDPESITAWRFAGEAARRSGARTLRVPVPHLVAWPLVRFVTLAARALLGPTAHLPAVLVPQRFAQGYRPLRYSTDRALDVLRWKPPLSTLAALDATWES